MTEKVITESFLRKTFLNGIPETFYLADEQILTPAAAQFLRDRRVLVTAVDSSKSATAITESDSEVADGTGGSVKPEQLTHLTGRQLVPKDHPRIVFRGWLDRFQAEVLLLQKAAEDSGETVLGRNLGELLYRAQAILRAEVTGEQIGPATFLGFDEEEIRQRSHHPQRYFGLQHLQLSARLNQQVLSLNQLRTLIRQAELAAVSAFAKGNETERNDLLKALNHLSSVIYVLMLIAAQGAQADGAVMDNRTVDEIVARVAARFSGNDQQIPVELSARHLHLSAKDVQTLFGRELIEVRELSQPGQFLCQERVRLIGPRGMLENIAVLGPTRGQTQIEISMTDARELGVTPPVRQSGDIAGSARIQIATDKATISVTEGLIVPARHIHMHPDDGLRFGVHDRQLVRVRVGTARKLVFEDILVRINENYRLAMHIDFDEGNACGWTPEMTGELLTEKTDNHAAEKAQCHRLNKRLLTEKDIIEVQQQGTRVLRISATTRLTPLALDCAREHGVQLLRDERRDK